MDRHGTTEASQEAAPPPRERRGRRWTLLIAPLAVAALVGSWWASGVTASGGMSRIWADDGPADVHVSGVGEELVVLDASRQQVEVSFEIGHRGPWPVQVVDVWDTTDPDRQLSCGPQPRTVTGASVRGWIETAPHRLIRDLQVPREELPPLRSGDQLYVTVHAEGFGDDCQHEGLASTDRVVVAYRTLGITRRTEIPLPWTLGWTDDPQAWPQVDRRDDPVGDED